MLPDNNKPENEEIPVPPPPPPPPPSTYPPLPPIGQSSGPASPYGAPMSPLPQFGAPMGPVQDQPGQRPGCVVAGVLLLALGVLLFLCGGVAMFSISSMGDVYDESSVDCYMIEDEEFCGKPNEVIEEVIERSYGLSVETVGMIIIAFGLWAAIAAIGIWMMKKWGIVLFLVWGAILGIMSLLSLVAGNFISILYLLLLGVAVFWLLQNRWRFV